LVNIFLIYLHEAAVIVNNLLKKQYIIVINQLTPMNRLMISMASAVRSIGALCPAYAMIASRASDIRLARMA
jgi:hypothetical protein